MDETTVIDKQLNKQKFPKGLPFEEYLLVKNSKIHNSGVFAKKFIPKGVRVIEYTGEKISKEEAIKRENQSKELARKNPSLGAVYIFELDETHDIDGNTPDNIARLINHSCNPNCEVEIEDGKIWYYSLRDIEQGEELSIDYGYDLDDDYREHICRCGHHSCVGYIVAEDERPALLEKLKNKKTH